MSKPEKPKLFWLVSSTILGFLAPMSFALALEVSYPTLPGGISLPPEPQLNEYVRYIYAFSIMISGFIAFGVLVFGGVLKLLSGTNISRAANAREWIAAGFWGILILLLSYIILATINPQLVGLEQVKFEPKAVPPYDITARTPLLEQKDIGFQIPMGKIIENASLSGDKRDFLVDGEKFKDNEEFREAIKQTIKEIVDLTKNLDPQLTELKRLIGQCNCGGSICAKDCSPEGCDLNCNLSAIHAKANQIKNSAILPALEKKEEKLAKYSNEVENRNLDLYKAVFLTTTFFDEVRDYFSFAIERETVAKIPDREIEIETLPEWEDIKLSIKTTDGRLIPDPATFYFWKRYKEMDDAISFASNAIGSVAGTSCPGTIGGVPGDTVCVPSNPDAFIWPAQGDITLRYGDTDPPYSTTHPHEGIDIANSVGTPVFAAADGKVIITHTGCPAVTGLNDSNAGCGGGLGNHIVIKHKDFDPNIGTIYTTYAHLKDILVDQGDNVTQGQQIGTMDTTGYVTGPHLHFTVGTAPSRYNIDPETYLPGTGSTVCGPGGGGGGGRCEVITDPNHACSVEKLRPYFGAKAEEASQICNAESGGNVWNRNDGCIRGGYDYSVGLFQINLYRTGRCDAVGIPESQIFEEISPSTCKIKNQSLANECSRRYGWGNGDLNAQKAVQIYNARGNWCAWSTACPLYCNLCNDWSSCP